MASELDCLPRSGWKSSTATGHRDTAGIDVYLSLPTPRLVLDLRQTDRFAAAHIAHATHIYPLHHIKARYSCLPPRTVPFLVIADVRDRIEVQQALSGCNVRRLIESDLFKQGASDNGKQDLSLLDLGCGAGRDMAWVLYGSQRERTADAAGSRPGPPPRRWRGVGLDNWKAVLNRTALLMEDLNLRGDGVDLLRGRCDALVWAKCTDEGSLEPLVGTGKGKTFALPAADEEQAAAWAAFEGAGLSRLSSQHPPAAPDDPGDGFYDLILSIRFYPSTLLGRLRSLVRPGGAILVSHFTVVTAEERSQLEAEVVSGSVVVDYDSPSVEGRLGPRDAEALAIRWNQEEEAARGADGNRVRCRWRVQQNLLEPIEDGRIVRSVVLQRCLEAVIET
ncbi:uncharacterized protein PFL1_00421 [Pseudozyma flocculosa PF-1]|uniref:Rhodanese domain-containing protein n=1 Tax=Pseudozyma flocculosa TaxID=84751 RepID=A0A5C3ERH3_9BASI|nr:uncharacterized protein PFL1_00421 [Pseudozyma flocculosa PF-1]EPQ32224.1 hypothetical protein PFL1_00421 [Pseudozyma flocculosa PF-1]SPO34828.1 uncharacterized protein PSFLO_00299 [Pseudozyma flocculosa]